MVSIAIGESGCQSIKSMATKQLVPMLIEGGARAHARAACALVGAGSRGEADGASRRRGMHGKRREWVSVDEVDGGQATRCDDTYQASA